MLDFFLWMRETGVVLKFTRDKMTKFVVVKGRNTVVGKAGCEYTIFDTVDFPFTKSKKVLENQMRKYVFRNLYEIDNKRAKDIRHDTWCRRRHIMKYDGTILIPNIKIFDHDDGTFYGFIPVDSFK